MRVTSNMLRNLNSSRTNSIRNSWSSNSSRRTNGLSNNSLRSNPYSSRKTSAAYQTTQKAAAEVRKNAEELTNTAENSIWDQAEKSGSNKDILEKVNGFLDGYNDMIEGMQKTGGSLNNIYRTQLSGAVSSNQSLLKELGITANRDGTLKVDQNKLKAADPENLKKAFAGSSSFGGQVAVKSIYVEANAVSGMSEQANAAYLGYNNYGGINNYGGYGSGLGQYFNSLY